MKGDQTMKRTYIQPMMQVMGLRMESRMLGGSNDPRSVKTVESEDGFKKSSSIWGENTLLR